MARTKLTKKELSRLDTSSPLFAPPTSDKEELAEDLDAIKSEALATANEADVLQAKRAIQQTRKLASGMTGLARALTKGTVPDLRVVVRADIGSSMTDGRQIFVKPNFELGAETEHDRRLCGETDPDTELQLCKACRALEWNVGSLYHEVGHVAYGTFEPVPDVEKAEIVKRSIAERGAHVGSRAQKLLDLFEQEFGATQSMTACKIISPYLGMLLNALEDARVNAATGRHSSGMDRIFRSRTRSAFVDGVKDEYGNRHHWNDRHPDEQVLIGCYLVASGYTQLLSYLDEDVAKALMDWDLRVLLNKISTAPSVHAIYASTFPILERLRALGFCVRKDDPEDDPAEEQVVLAAGMAGMPEDQDGPPQSGETNGDMSGALPDVADDPTADGGNGSGETPTGARDDSDEPDGADGADEPTDGATGDDGADEPTDETDGSGEGAEDADDDEDPDQDQGDGGQGAEEDADGDDAEDGNGGHQQDDQDNEGDEGNGEESGHEPEPNVDEIDESLKMLQGHEMDGKVWHEGTDDRADLMRAVDAQFDQFDAPSRNVLTMRVHHWNDKSHAKWVAWGQHGRWHEDIEVPAASYNRALALARIVFSDNAAIRRSPLQRTGQINQKHLCYVPAGMKRPFQRTRFPNGRDYKICLTLDCSGSTSGPRNKMIRQIGLGVAKLLSGLPGVDFEVWGHTATYVDDYSYSYSGVIYQGDMHEVKAFGRPWGTQEERALQALHSSMDNLDGHTMEFCRKRVESQHGTDRIILYLTDGEMPAANRYEEQDVLERELQHCERVGIKVIGIGVNTDSPTQYGLDTIRMDDPSDLKHLITEIGKRLA